MGILPDHSMSGSAFSRELSASAQAASAWLRQLARGVKSARLYRVENPIVQQIRDQVADGLTEHLRTHGRWPLTITPSEILLEDEVVVRPIPRAGGGSSLQAPEEQLPFTLYRDGIRGITLLPGVPRGEVDALFDALREVGSSASSQEDLVTLLWQANLQHIQIDSVPIEQTIYLSTRQARKDSVESTRGLAYGASPTGDALHADFGMGGGSQGLHRDTFDDWPLPEVHAQPGHAYRAMLPAVEALHADTLASWEEERRRPWSEQAAIVLREIFRLDPSEDTRQCLSHSIVSWLVDEIRRSEWESAMRALTLLREFDPDLSRSGPDIQRGLRDVPGEEVAAHLDEAEPETHGRFTALLVALGPPSVDLVLSVLAASARIRPRAAACLALSYICGDDPRLLAAHLEDPRWFVVRNVVFVLGQIGGPEVVELLRTAALHPEPRVKRAVVQALGNVSRVERTPVLMNLLDSTDPQLFSATLNMLTREKNPRITKALLDRVTAPEFEELAEDNQRALFNALGDVAEEDLIEPLAQLLTRGGWFAKPSMVRVGAARTLRRIGTERALAVLEDGLRSRSIAVRAACLDAMSTRSAT